MIPFIDQMIETGGVESAPLEEKVPAAPDYTVVRTRERGGPSLRYCSHGLPFEDACEACVDAALAAESARAKAP